MSLRNLLRASNPDAAKYVILGGSGQLGQALNSQIDDRVVVLGREQADLTKLGELRETLLNLAPESIINAAAYTAVDLAEDEPEIAHLINAKAPEVLAEVACELGIPLVHVSTDYVFDGTKAAPYVETDEPSPTSVYGESKLAGEQAIQQVMAECDGQYMIIRTSWVYDFHSQNFMNTMLRLAKHHQELTVVADQIGAPTYAPHLAQGILQLLENADQSDPFPSGVYHLCGSGETSWHGFATAIIDGAHARDMDIRAQTVKPITTEEYPTKATRPADSRLDCSYVKNLLGVALPTWQQGLNEALDAK